MQIKTIARKGEAQQVPIQKVHEASKDLEQRFAKVCAWLYDQNGIADVEFDHTKGLIWFAHAFAPNKRYEAVTGDHIVIFEREAPQLYDEINFARWIEVVE